MENAPHILVADDDPEIASLLRETLGREGFAVECALDGAQALDSFRRTAASDTPFDLVILDIMMPCMNGFEACQAIRRLSDDVPVLFLSAKDEESDQVIGFALGADDYVTKPFKSRELIARIRARLRRQATSHADTPPGLLTVGNLEVDLLRHAAFLHDEPLSLTPKEFGLLHALMLEPGCPVSTKRLFEIVWNEPYNTSDSNTVMVHIRRLRKKLAKIDSRCSHIETVFGVGYRIPDPPAGPSATQGRHG